MNTPITDRSAYYVRQSMYNTKRLVPIETARALERIAGEMEAALQSACDSFAQLVEIKRAPENMKGYRDAKAAFAKFQAMKDEATK